MRELVEGVRYKPAVGRYRIYIIDEVHMLSTAAFNALLKTLEEPPEHSKFIFCIPAAELQNASTGSDKSLALMMSSLEYPRCKGDRPSEYRVSSSPT